MMTVTSAAGGGQILHSHFNITVALLQQSLYSNCVIGLNSAAGGGQVFHCQFHITDALSHHCNDK